MLKKLRNKFLFFNLAITTSLILIVFTTIFLVIFFSVHKDTASQLIPLFEAQSITDKITQYSVVTEPEADQSGDESEEGAVLFVSKEDYEHFIESMYPNNFILSIDASGNVSVLNSMYGISEDSAQTVSEKTLEDGNATGIIQVDEVFLQYGLVEMDGDPESLEIFCLDITDSIIVLKTTLKILIVVALFTLVSLFFISKIFANRAIIPISEALDKQKRFIADASHELKTPITVIDANYGVLKARKSQTIESQEKWLDYIKSGSDRMSSLVDDMLELAKIDEGALKVNIAPFNVSNQVTMISEAMEMIAYEKAVTIECAIEPDIIANSDLEKYMQVATILIDNAMKYVDDNGFVKIELRKERYTILKVTNTGAGIPKEDLEHVFDRFYRVDKSRANQNRGHGLGLAIASSIADGLSGKILVESVENEFTTFTFIV